MCEISKLNHKKCNHSEWITKSRCDKAKAKAIEGPDCPKSEEGTRVFTYTLCGYCEQEELRLFNRYSVDFPGNKCNYNHLGERFGMPGQKELEKEKEQGEKQRQQQN